MQNLEGLDSVLLVLTYCTLPRSWTIPMKPKTRGVAFYLFNAFLRRLGLFMDHLHKFRGSRISLFANFVLMST